MKATVIGTGWTEGFRYSATLLKVEQKVSGADFDEIVKTINGIEGLLAYKDVVFGKDGFVIAVEKHGEQKEAVADAIEAVEGFPHARLKWVKSHEESNIAWFAVGDKVTYRINIQDTATGRVGWRVFDSKAEAQCAYADIMVHGEEPEEFEWR